MVPTPANVRVNDPNADTGSPNTTQSEPSLAVNPPNIVVCYNDSNPSGSFCGYSNSSTAGSAFTDRGAIAGPQNGDGVMAVDSSGTFYIAMLSNDNAGNSSIGVSNSTDGGVTFSAAVQASAAVNSPTTFADKPWLTVDATGGPNDGNLYLAWTSFTNFFGNAQILFTRSTDGGATWSAPLALSTVGPGLGHQGATPVVAPDGRVYVVWLDRSTGQLLIARSDDGGATFNNPVTGGGAITTISLIPSPLNGSIRANSFPSIAVAPSGVVHVVYPASVGADNADVFHVRSTDQGQSWSVPLRVNDDTTTTDQWMPSVAVTSDGTVGVMVYDRRNDASNLNIDIYLAISRDDGVTFEPNSRITNTSFPPAVNFDPAIAFNYMGDYNQMVAVDGDFFMVWGDNRDLVGTRNDPNVYFGAVATTTVQLQPSSGFATQGRFGSKGNFEVVAPLQAGRLAHFWRDNDAATLPWHGPTPFGSNDQYDPVALIQSNFSTAGAGPGNLEVVAHTGNRLLHYWRDDVNPFPWHVSVSIPGASGALGPALIQGHFGTKGNFEVVAALAAGRLAHFWRDNDAPTLPWHGPIAFGSTDVYDAVALIQSNFSTAGNGPGNLEVVAHTGNRLLHYWRDDVNPFPWHVSVAIPGSIGTTATPTLIQGGFGTKGNFEVVVPMASGGLAHFWRDNDAAGLPWHGPTLFGSSDVYDAVALIQSNFSTSGAGPGNLEVIAHTGNRLDHYWREDVNPFPWHGPFAIPGATGIA